MALVVALNEIGADQIKQQAQGIDGDPGAIITNFFRASRDKPDAPTAKLNRYSSGEPRYSAAHFHEVDQFQIIMEGKGTFGRHDVSPYCIHFSRAYTPYGPLVSDKDTGWAFLVMRTRFDPGAQRFPASLDKLKQIPDRRPWQITSRVSFPPQGDGASLLDVPEIKDDQGLFSATLTMAPHATTTAPDPSHGEGQYLVVVKGSLVYDNRERPAPAVVFTKPEEGPFQIVAGAHGLEAIIMNFPRATPRPVDARAPSTVAGFKKLQCQLCAFTYDEALGLPDDGIAAGTRWTDVPDTWSCPDCSATKSDFQMVEI